MMRWLMVLFPAVLGLALLPAPLLAWGQTGHRVSGEIADRHLGPKARAGVRELLGGETLAEASSWPDFMRSAPGDFWQKQSGPWHYVTIPPGKSWAEVGPPPEGDAVTALKRFAATVKDRSAPLAERQTALRFIVHIVGDLSQPLHVGRPGDRGGNDVKVTFFGEPTNLHALWDTGLVDRQQLGFTEWADWLLGNAGVDELRAWSSPDPMQWLTDSAAIRDGLYPPAGTTQLGYAYAFQHDRTMRQQLTKGGLRLAAYLNALFDAP